MDYNARFQQAVKRRDAFRGKLERLQGKLEGSKSRLSEVEERCHQKKIDPAQIGGLIVKVQNILQGRVEMIELKIQEAEDHLSPYLEVSA